MEDFCYITDNTYTKQEIVKMEADVLLALQFELGNPTTNTFLRLLESDMLFVFSLIYLWLCLIFVYVGFCADGSQELRKKISM